MGVFRDAGTFRSLLRAGMRISRLAELIKDVVGFEGENRYDISKPDGTPRKLLGVERMAGVGWKAEVSLREGVEGVYGWHVDKVDGY